MSVGYIVAAEADIGSAREIADGFDLELIGAGAIGDHAATAAALARAANVGLVLSPAAAADPSFSALLRALATQLGTAQLILATSPLAPSRLAGKVAVSGTMKLLLSSRAIRMPW